eukprot:9452874-Heterocapsa_arctica.AAC.1
MDGDTRDLLAEIIVHKNHGNPSVDTTSHGKTKIKQRHLVMSNKSNNGMETNVNWDLNILGERPNIKTQADKKSKY